MAYDVLDPSDVCGIIPAGADLSTHQFKFVQAERKSGTLSIVLSATAGARVFGVLQDKPTAQGQACLVAGRGISKVVAEGPINAGDYVVASTAGLAITSSTTAHHRVGKALESASLLGDIIAVQLGSYGPQVP
jgi:hypothetical protein